MTQIDSNSAATADPFLQAIAIDLLLGGLPYLPNGPAYTAGALAAAMNQSPFRVTVHASDDCWKADRPAVPVVTARSAASSTLARLYWTALPARARLRFLEYSEEFASKAGPENLVWLFGDQSLDVARILHARGARVVREKINIGKRLARKVYQEERDRTGLAITNEISEAACIKEDVEMELADAIFCPSPMTLDSMRHIGVPEEKLLPTSYGWEPSRLAGSRSALPPAKGPTFLYVGYVCFHKGAHILIDAWEKAGIDGRLVLAGRLEPEFKNAYGKRINRPDIVQLGFIRDIGAVYRSADWFIFPSLAEGGPQVTYEAAGCGVPAITSYAGAGNMTRHGLEGIVITDNSAEPLADAIREATGNSSLRDRMGQAARLRAEDFTWAKIGTQRLTLLRERFGI